MVLYDEEGNQVGIGKDNGMVVLVLLILRHENGEGNARMAPAAT